MKYTKNLVLFNLIVINLIDQPTPPIVIEQGILTGIINSDGTIFEYIGIPYGVFNSSNRFQAPYPAPNWEGTFKATEESFCPHFFIFKTWGTEDCLKVNVYVPARAVKPVPVMFYIHGGGFTIGSGGKLLYGPEFLVRHDVILVTLNYRLDLIGFLCLGIKEAPGNTALRDQIAALRWVKKNIAAFGGDPDNITLFGQSAGGVAASALYASKSTNGLFNKIIVQSGSSSANWAMNVNPLWTARFMAKQLGHDGVEDPHELLEIFSKMSYKELLSVQPKRPISKNFDTELLQLPCIERRIPGVEPIIDDLPYNLMKNHPKNIPIMYSTSNREGLFLMAFENNEKLKTKENCNLFASDLTFPNEDIAVEVAKSIREFYFGSENYTVALKDSIIKYCTQLYFEIPAQLETELILDNNKAPVYNLIFEYSGGRNFMKYGLGYYDTEGACHGDETLYLFNGRLWVLPVSKEDQVIIDYMTQFWTNFAKYSNPTPPWQNTSIKWDPSEKGNLKFLYVNNHLKMGPLPNPEGYNLWKNIYQKNPTPPWQNTSIKWDPSEKGNLKFLYVNNHLKMGPLPNPEGYNLWKNIYQKYRRRDAEFYFS